MENNLSFIRNLKKSLDWESEGDPHDYAVPICRYSKLEQQTRHVYKRSRNFKVA